MISILLHLAFGYDMDAEQESIHAEVPHTIEEVLKRFNLDGRTTTYAMCPSCHNGHPPLFHSRSKKPSYPTRCNKNILDQGLCGEPLLRDDEPILPFVYCHIDDYIASLLSRKELEEHLDRACDDLAESLDADEQTTFVHDIFESKFMKTFKGPDEKQPFVYRSGECRLAFSLCVDHFNVGGMRKRGPSVSSGIIALACLNLPLNIRYKPEYMYLAGIIPGPRAAHGAALNHYLKPLIDDFEESWRKGVFYRRTALYPNGRVARAAIVCEVCDLVGARELAGLAPNHSNHFCSVCELTGRANLGNYEKERWGHRDITEIRRQAEAWRDAPTLDARQKLYEAHGVAWSELYRLPYYDPTRQLTVDAMHCILEGLVQFHFREVLKLTTVDAKANPKTVPAFDHIFRHPVPLDNPDRNKAPLHHQLDAKSLADVNRIHSDLTSPILCDALGAFPNAAALLKRLETRRKDAVQFVYEDLALGIFDKKTWRVRNKKEFANDLVQWVSRFCHLP